MHIPGIRLDSLETFLVVAREGSLRRASAALFLTPSGVTRRIRALEQQLGRELLETTTRTATLTPVGRALLPHAQEFVSAARRMLVLMDNIEHLTPVQQDDLGDAAHY